MRKNPFDNPTTIHNPEDFWGRDKELGQIFGDLEKKLSISLVAPKRMGKTSLVNCLQNEQIQKKYGFAGESFLFIYIDLPVFGLRPETNFLAQLCSVLRRHKLCMKYLVDIVPKESIEDEFTNLLSILKLYDLHPVLIMDTFDVIIQYKQADADLFSFLRALGSMKLVSYITSSTQTLAKLCPSPPNDNKGSPFFAIFRLIRLELFSHKEAWDILSALSLRENLPFSEAEITWVIQEAGRHPCFLTCVGAELFREKLMVGAGPVNFQRVRREAQQNLEDHFANYWNMLDEDVRLQLVQEVKLQDKTTCQYPEVIESSLFCEYILNQVSSKKVATSGKEGILALTAKSTEIDRKEFETLLMKLKQGDVEALEGSVLAQSSLVASYIPLEKAHEPFIKGKTVKILLKDLVEQMRADGNRKDTPPEWRLYNILHYRYFGNWSITHKQIAARLAISERQYYREYKNAISRFLSLLKEAGF